MTEGTVKTTVPIQTGLDVRFHLGLRLCDRLREQCVHRERQPDVPVRRLDHRQPSELSADDRAADVHLRRQFLHVRCRPGRRYVSVTGNGQTYPVNPYQFSINGEVYIINTNVQPNTVIGGGST